MDENTGKFRMLSEEEAAPHVAKRDRGEVVNHFFRTGEEIEIRGSVFRVQSIKPSGMRLKLLRRPAES